MKVGKAHCKNRNCSAKNRQKILFTEFGYRNSDKAAEKPGPKLKLKSMIWLKQMGMKPYSELDKIKIDNYTPQENPALETLKKWYK
jgi:hypothetical protein